MKNLRKEDRANVKGGVLYAIAAVDSDKKIYSGLVSNLSDSGACIYIQERLSESTDLQIYFREISLAPVEAKVIWCSQDSSDIYRVGVRLEH
ncbi:hypothetical protein LCGC14_2304380 [marine sediment metagenome]|uniref:PilZ domain-containing protein n=1 Tax=marine sediment metagenome TaxID=412755 RepID=A0A0F9EZX7_9ZZZZ